MGVTVRIHLDKRSQIKVKDNTYPLKLKVTYEREKRYYKIESSRLNPILTNDLEKFQYSGSKNFSLDEDTFNEVMESKKGVKKRFQDILMELERKYQNVADSLIPFTFESFKKQYEDKKLYKENDVFYQLERKVKGLKEDERFNSATVYQNTLKSLQTFSKLKTLKFEVVTSEFLKKYAKWMKDKGKSETTTSIYLRHLRELFNYAISLGITKSYPFHNNQNKSGFKIPTPAGRKIALTTDELKAIFNHVYENSHPGRFYVDSWKIMYLLQGLNAYDLCKLQYSDINNGFIEFVRQKTRRSNSTEIKIPVNNQIKYLIELWGNPQESKSTYLWPVIKSDDLEKQFNQVKQFVKLVNKYMKRLAAELEIEKKVTTYVTRHSYATQLMKHGAPVAFISKQLGHSNTKTTDNYLNSFEDKALKEWQEKISEF